MGPGLSQDPCINLAVIPSNKKVKIVKLSHKSWNFLEQLLGFIGDIYLSENRLACL